MQAYHHLLVNRFQNEGQAIKQHVIFTLSFLIPSMVSGLVTLIRKERLHIRLKVDHIKVWKSVFVIIETFKQATQRPK